MTSVESTAAAPTLAEAEAEAQADGSLARAGLAMAVATLAMAAASGLQALAYLSSFGVTARTDAFFAAFALYAVFGIFCQSIRVTSVPLLVGGDEVMRGRVYAATLVVIAIPVLIACEPLAGPVASVIAPGVSESARQVTQDGLHVLGGAMVLQLGAAGAATLLGVWDRFDVVAGAYISGAVAGCASYFLVQGPADELALGWSMLTMGAVTAGWMFIGLERARTERTPGRVPGPAALGRNAGVILGRTVVYFVINGLFIVTMAFVSNASAGDSTVLSYSYLFVSYLVAGTGVAVGIARTPDMTRGVQDDWHEVVADTVPHGFRYAIMVSAPAVAALVTGGASLTRQLVPSGFSQADVTTLRTFTALLGVWLVAALLVNYLLPALFALGRARLVNTLALPVVAIHIIACVVGQALFGAEGVVGGFFVAPLIFGAVLLGVGAGSRAAHTAWLIVRDAVLFLGCAAVAFGAAAALGSLIDPGAVRSVAVVLVGSALYLAALTVVAGHQLRVMLAARRSASSE